MRFVQFLFFRHALALNNDIMNKYSPDDLKQKLDDFKESESTSWGMYYEASNQGVNDKKQRELRNTILEQIL